ncbi:LysM peptidoglycan-binding domain-containing protein [Paenibacillus tarimensis]
MYVTKTGSEQKQALTQNVQTGSRPASDTATESTLPSNHEPAGIEQSGSLDAPNTNPVSGESTSVNAESRPSTDAGEGETEHPDGNQTSPKQEINGHTTSLLSGETAKLPTTYVVQVGDTLSSISMKFYHSKEYVSLLSKHNNIVFVNDMKVGETIKIPALSDPETNPKDQRENLDYSKITLPATYMVRPGDTLFRISMLFYQSKDYVDLIAEQNKLDTNETLNAGTNIVIPAIPVTDKADAGNSNASVVKEHTVQQGETLSSISRKYYNSSKYANIIAEYNLLKDHNDVKVGQVLKIPASPVP